MSPDQSGASGLSLGGRLGSGTCALLNSRENGRLVLCIQVVQSNKSNL